MNKTIFRKPIATGPRMRVAILALCAVMLGTTPLLAQDNATPPPPATGQAGPPAMGSHGGRMGGHQAERLTRRLNLSPDQAAQVKTIDEDTMKQAMAVRDDSSLSKADRRAKMMDLRKASQDKIRAVLNDEQKTKYDAMLTKMRERRMEQRGQGAPTPPPPAAPQP